MDREASAASRRVLRTIQSGMTPAVNLRLPDPRPTYMNLWAGRVEQSTKPLATSSQPVTVPAPRPVAGGKGGKGAGALRTAMARLLLNDDMPQPPRFGGEAPKNDKYWRSPEL